MTVAKAAAGYPYLHGAAAGQNGRHDPGRLLQLKGADIAAQCGAIEAPLISRKQHAEFIATTARIAGVDGRAAGKQRVGLGWPAVVLQGTEIRVP